MVQNISSIISKNKQELGRKARVVGGVALGIAIAILAARLERPETIVYEGEIEEEVPTEDLPDYLK